MYYIQELESIIGDANLNKEELVALTNFSDEKVGFKESSNNDYLKDVNLQSAYRKLKERKLFGKYLKLLLNHQNDNINNFFKKMDEEL